MTEEQSHELVTMTAERIDPALLISQYLCLVQLRAQAELDGDATTNELLDGLEGMIEHMLGKAGFDEPLNAALEKMLGGAE